MLGAGMAAVLWLLAAQVEEGKGQAVDRELTTTTRHAFDGEYFRVMPLIGHRYQDMLAMAPGVSDHDADGRLNVHGARETSNEWRLDGAEVTDPRFSDSALELDPIVIERIGITTAGAPASQGRALGGFADVVTRSGGNDLTGAVALYWGGRFLDGDGAGNEDVARYDGAPAEFHDARLSGSLGGAILKDRLWWFASAERLETEDPSRQVATAPIVSTQGYFAFGKLTWQADPSNTLTLQMAADPRRVRGLGLDFLTSPETDFVLDRGSRTTRLGWRSIVSSAVMLEASLSRLDSDQDVDPISSRFEPIEIQILTHPSGFGDQAWYPCRQVNCSEALGEDRLFRLNVFTGRISGPWFERSRDDRRRDALRADLSATLQARHGTHHLYGGFEAGREESDLNATINPILYDATVRGFSPDPNSQVVSGFQLLEVSASGAVPHNITGSYGAIYLSDTFKPHPSLSITAGVRLDGEELDFPGYEPFDPGQERRRSIDLWRAVCEEAERQNLVPVNSNCHSSRPFNGSPPSSIGSTLQTFVDRDSDGVNDVHASVVALDVNGDGVFELGGEGAGLFKHFTNLDDRVPGRFSLKAENLSPRLAVSWDPSNAGRWKLFGTWGRYHDRFHADAAQVEAGGETRLFTFLPDGSQLIRPGALSRAAPTASIGQVDHDLEPARMDELSLGAECTVGDVWRLGLTYVHRRTDGLLQDADLNHFTCVQAGSAIGIDPIVLCPDPNGQLDTDRFGQSGGSFIPSSFPNGLEDLYAFSPRVNQVLRVSGIDGLEDDSWELAVVKPMQHNWQMRAGYTRSRARGEAAETFSSVRDDVSVLPRRRTPLDHDQRHSLELQAAGRLPHDVTLSTAVRWDSGIPYTVVGGSVIDMDSNRNTVPRQLLPTGEMNDQRNEGRWRVDARVEKGLQFRKVRAAAFLTVVNVLDDDSLTLLSYTQGEFVEGFRDFGRRFEIGSTISF